MQGKYPNWFVYQLAKLRRAPMVAQLRDLVSWEPLEDPEKGCTIVIGCMAALPDVAVTNLNLMRRMHMPSVKEVILVFDRPEAEMPSGLIERLEAARGDMPLRILHYTQKQHAVAERIQWGWVYAWMSWTTGIAHARTQHVLLHDLDAMPVQPDFFEKRYQLARESGNDFFGIRWYKGNGVIPDDELTTTFEMVLNAQTIRAHTKPIHAFNTITKVKDRACDLDTFLYSQILVGNSGQAPIDEGDMVHPSQMICQYTDLIAGRNTHAMPKTNLPLMPVYMHLGGNSAPMREITHHLESEPDAKLPFMDRRFDISKLTQHHWVWLEREARKLGEAATGGVDEPLDTYLGLLRTRVEANQA